MKVTRIHSRVKKSVQPKGRCAATNPLVTFSLRDSACTGANTKYDAAKFAAHKGAVNSRSVLTMIQGNPLSHL